jgi:L-serine dehydratase
VNSFDIIGPVMVGPSSSHTAGAVRIGLIARELAAAPPEKARIGLAGSFAGTGRGHGTDKAILGGLLGFNRTTRGSA